MQMNLILFWVPNDKLLHLKSYLSAILCFNIQIDFRLLIANFAWYQ